MSARNFDRAVIEKTIAAAAATYTANDQVGTLLTFTGVCNDSGGHVVLEEITLLDKAKQKVAADFFFFRESPTLISGDQDEFDLTAAMMERCVGVATVSAADYKDTKNFAIASTSISKVLKSLSRSKDLFALMVTRGTPTYTANCLVAKFAFARP